MPVLHTSPYARLVAIFFEKLSRYAANFAVTYSALASEEFHQLLEIVYKAGQRSVGVEFEAIFTSFSPQTLSRKITEFGEAEHIRSLKETRGQLVCLLIDSGTVGGRKYLLSLVSSPQNGHHSFPMEFSFIKEDINGYSMYISQLISQLRSQHGIIVASVVTDGLRALVEGSRQGTRASQTLLEGKSHPLTAFHSPCCAHRVQLALKWAIRSDKTMKRVMSLFGAVSTELRKKKMVELIGSRCPAVVETRWMYHWRIVSFFLEKGFKMQNLSSETLTFVENLPWLCILLRPLKELTDVLESGSATHPCVYPAVCKALEEYESIIDSKDSRISLSIKLKAAKFWKSLFQQTIGSPDGALFPLSFCFTGEGRRMIVESKRSKVEVLVEKETVTEMDPCDIEVQNIRMEMSKLRQQKDRVEWLVLFEQAEAVVMFLKGIPAAGDVAEDAESTTESTDILEESECGEVQSEDELAGESESDEGGEIEEIPAMRAGTLVLPEEIRKERALPNLEKGMITSLAKLLQLDMGIQSEEEIQRICSCACEWMTGTESPVLFESLTADTLKRWTLVEACDKHWGGLARIVRRLMVTAASEADCERQFSRMKYLVGLQRQSLSQRSLNALLNLVGRRW
jgi:hypothetical protein